MKLDIFVPFGRPQSGMQYLKIALNWGTLACL